MKRNKTIKFNNNEFKNIKLQFSSRKKIQQAIKQYNYNNKQSHEKNMQSFCELIIKQLAIQSDLGLRFLQSFRSYINIENNIPIQVNFKSLKYQQVISLIQEWQVSLKQPDHLMMSQRLYTINYRNILFNRIFVQQKTNIQQYFETISDQKMLKPVDIYQLLLDILSHYYLYEFAQDNGTFFQKINSFNKFLQVVQKFKHSQKRIIINNKANDFAYIKIYEFQALINYWQLINPQLQLRSDIRFSICNVQVQTQRHMILSVKDQQIQTIDETWKSLTLQILINKTIKDFNRITQDQSNPQKLEIIQNICQNLRKSKIQICQLQQSNLNDQKIKNQNNANRLSTNSRSKKIQQNINITVQDDQKSQSQKTQKISIKHPRIHDESRQKSFSKRKQCQKSKQKIKYQYQNKINSYNSFITQQNFYQSNRKSQQKAKKYNNKETIKQKNEPYFRKTPQKVIQRKASSKQRKFSFQKNILFKIQDQYKEIRNQNNTQILKNFEKIFKYYSNPQNQSMNIQSLNEFFIDIGIIHKDQKFFTYQLIRRNTIINPKKITIINFLQLMDEIGKKDPDLTNQVIIEFVDLYITAKDHKNQQKYSLEPPNSFFSFKKSPSKVNITQNIQISSQQKSRRYKYSEDNPKIDQSSTIKARKRGNIPVNISHRVLMERPNRF